MTQVVLYTIPGTGTRFTAKLLTEVFGFKPATYRDVVITRRFPQTFTQFHVRALTGYHHFSPDKRLDIVPADVKVVTTLRHPLSAQRTRARQGDPPLSQVSFWQELIRIAEARPMEVVVVDNDLPRFKQLCRLGTHIGAVAVGDGTHAALETLQRYAATWEKVGAAETSRNPLLVTSEDEAKLAFAVEWYEQQVKLARAALEAQP